MALANALEIAPSELTKLPVPVPGNGGIDDTSSSAAVVFSPDGHTLASGSDPPGWRWWIGGWATAGPEAIGGSSPVPP